MTIRLILALAVTLASCSGCLNGAYEAAAGRTIVPFQDKLGLVLIHAVVEDRPYTFLLDTGVSEMIISNEVAEKLGWRPSRTVRLRDTNDELEKAERLNLREVEIGGFTFRNQPARIVDLAHSEGLGEVRIDGIIGASLMRKAYWRIDFRTREVAIFEDAGRLPRGRQSTFIPFEASESGRPYVDVRLDSALSQPFLLDLGYNGEIELPYKELRTLADRRQLRRLHGWGGGTRGLFGSSRPDSMMLVTIPDVGIGSLRYRALSRGRHGAQRKLGTGLFQDQVVTLDWRRQGMYIETAGR